ncbi:MAG: hypothetical protein PHO08_08320 [Methylococcales bacterium]|nr:hypothetical protein [Methylococcales bacterium]
MPFHLIKGTFHVVGYSPDGDSIWFQADDLGNWGLLDGPPVGLNASQVGCIPCTKQCWHGTMDVYTDFLNNNVLRCIKCTLLLND